MPLDPVTVDRVEIVRGPAALLYGGNAIGGVVNTFDNRIPDTPIEGIHGAGELRYGGADTTRSSAGKLEAGNGAFALHLDANSRQFNDLRIPGYARSSKVRDADEPGSKHRTENSDGREDGGAVGGAYHWDQGYAGLSYSHYDSNYGSVAEPGVLDMKQDHYAFASELRDWTARSLRSRSMPAIPTTSTVKSKKAKSTPPSGTRAMKHASKPATNRSGRWKA